MTANPTPLNPDDDVEIDLSHPEAWETPDDIEWDVGDFDDVELIAPLEDWASSWSEMDAAALLSGRLDEDPPACLRRTDDVYLLYPGKVSSIAGEPESGKGWFAMLAVVQAIADGRHVVYVDFEDGPRGVFGRLRALRVPDHIIAEKFHYVRPTEKLAEKGGTRSHFAKVVLRAVKAQGGLALIVFDGITEALTHQEVESNDNDKVAEWFGLVPRWFAQNTGAAVLLIDHVVKASDSRGRFAVGAGAKLAAVDGSQFTIKVEMAFARNRNGLARISVTKDRPGFVREYAVGSGHTQAIADMVITAGKHGEGSVLLTLVPPDFKKSDGDTPPGVQGEIVKYLRKVKGQGRQRQQILDMVKGRAQVKRQAFNDMLDNGWLVEYKDGRKTMFKLAPPEKIEPEDNEDPT